MSWQISLVVSRDGILTSSRILRKLSCIAQPNVAVQAENAALTGSPKTNTTTMVDHGETWSRLFGMIKGHARPRELRLQVSLR